MKRTRKRKKKSLFLPVLCIVVLSALLAGALWQDNLRMQHLRQLAEESRRTERQLTLEWNGQTYRLREDVSGLLIFSPEYSPGKAAYNHQPPAVRAMLLVRDETARELHLLRLNCDTLCEVPVLGEDGRYLGTEMQRLALAHTYGSGSGDSCRNMVSAVRRLLLGIPVDHYLRLSAEPLSQMETETLASLREELSGLSNVSEKEEKAMQERFGKELESNLTVNDWLELAESLRTDTFAGQETLPGVDSPEGFLPEENDLRERIIELFYEPVKENR